MNYWCYPSPVSGIVIIIASSNGPFRKLSNSDLTNKGHVGISIFTDEGLPGIFAGIRKFERIIN